MDASQTSDYIRVTNDQGYAALFSDIASNAKRSADFAAAASTPTRDLAPTCATVTGAKTRPPRLSSRAVRNPPPSRYTTPVPLHTLDASPAVGDTVIIPRETHPAYSCSELGGAGWESTVVRAFSTAALVSYTSATTRDGRLYEPELLMHNALRRL